MKKTMQITALLLAALMLFACGNKQSDDTTTTTTTATTAAPTPEEPVGGNLTITYDPKSGSAKDATGDNAVELTVTRAYKEGDKITITLPEGQKYLAFCMAKGVVEETILYLPNSVFTFTAQNMTMSYPSELTTKKCTITARIPTVEELTASRNLACNPADLEKAKNVFPHATSTSVHNKTNETDRLHFEARNAIDGFTQNNGHGGFPVQSWGPTSSMRKSDNFTVQLGRDVSLTKIVIYIRADFPHDTYWDSCTVTFSDGSTQEITLKKTANAQTIELEVPVTTSSVKFSNFNKVAGSDWASWMEVELIGSDIVG
jgi:hypothetical protein